MIEGKGCLVAADVAVKIVQKYPNVDFCFVGDGPLKQHVNKILQPLVDEERCLIKGSLSQGLLANEFRESDFFLFPSFRKGESLGLVVLEAMACGAVPLCINQAAIMEIIGNEERIVCSSPKDFYNLIDSSLAMNNEDVVAIRSALIKRAATYDRQIVSNQLIELFQKIDGELS